MCQFSAWFRLTPKLISIVVKHNLGGITKRGDMYVRMLLIQGAKAAVLTAHLLDYSISKWAHQLLYIFGKKRWWRWLTRMRSFVGHVCSGKPFDAAHVSVKPVGLANR